jgi:hypothetical protein
MDIKQILKDAGIENPALEASLQNEITDAQDKSGFVPKERFNEVNKKWRELEATHAQTLLENEDLKKGSTDATSLKTKITELEGKVKTYEDKELDGMKNKHSKVLELLGTKPETNKTLSEKVEKIKGKFLIPETGKELTPLEMTKNIEVLELLTESGYFTTEEGKITIPPANNGTPPAPTPNPYKGMFPVQTPTQ